MSPTTCGMLCPFLLDFVTVSANCNNTTDYIKQQYFKTLKHITDYHHFYIDAQQPGIATCEENASSESFTLNLLKCKSKTPQRGVLPDKTVMCNMIIDIFVLFNILP
jgi:hypothetical protein